MPSTDLTSVSRSEPGRRPTSHHQRGWKRIRPQPRCRHGHALAYQPKDASM